MRGGGLDRGFLVRGRVVEVALGGRAMSRKAGGKLDEAYRLGRSYACWEAHEFTSIAWSRGVKCRFISEKPEEGKGLESFLQFCGKTNRCEVRFIPSRPSPILSVYDKKEILLIVDPKTGISESSALWSNNPSILSALEDYFDILWLTAMETPSYMLDPKKVFGPLKHR